MEITPKDTKTFSLMELIEKMSTLRDLFGSWGIPTDVKSIEVENNCVYFKTT